VRDALPRELGRDELRADGLEGGRHAHVSRAVELGGQYGSEDPSAASGEPVCLWVSPLPPDRC